MSHNEIKALPLNDADFAQALKSTLPVVVDFWASWCGPCRTLAPIIDELAEAYAGKIVFYKLNIDENAQSTSQYSIKSIPTLIVFKDGQPVERITGVESKISLEEKLDVFIAK